LQGTNIGSYRIGIDALLQSGISRPPLPLFWQRICSLTGFIIVLSGLTIQSCIVIDTFSPRGYGPVAMLLKMLSYFTILTNLLVAASHGIALTAPESRPGRWLMRPAFSSALLLYTTLVGSLYLLLLSPFLHLQGWQWVANAMLHYITPLLYLIFWLLFVPKEPLPWRLALVWLAYPLGYLLWVLGRGALLGDYPYFFINPLRQGYGRTLACAGLLGIVFLLAGFAVIAGNRALHGSRRRRLGLES